MTVPHPEFLRGGKRGRAKQVEVGHDPTLWTRVISEGIRKQAVSPNLYGYVPHDKQKIFHRSEAHSRLYIGGNRCLAAGTEVLMADGSTKPIEKVSVGDFVIAGNGRKTKVLATWDNGIKSVNTYSIGRYQDVVEVTCTPDHKFWGAVETQGVLRAFGKRPIARLVNSRGRHKLMRSQGTSLGGKTEPRAAILGLMLGDGYMGKSPSNLQFTCADPTLIEDFPAVFDHSRGIQYRLVKERSYFEWFEELGLIGTKSATKFIPKVVWSWDEESIAEFCGALIATDGSFYSNKNEEYRVDYSSNSYEMISEFRRLMGIRLGIWGSTITYESRGTYSVTYGTREALARINGVLPIYGIKKTRQDFLYCKNSFSSYVGVKKFKSAGTANTYDITVEDESHTFMLANGLITSNSGKTVGGVVEDIFWLIQRHPYKKLPIPDGMPTRGRICSVDFTSGVAGIILPVFQKYIPPSFLINGSWEDSFSKSFRTLTLANGSWCEFKSYDQELEKFAGTSLHFTHYDEEPPESIYNECEARLVDTNGYSWATMTPVEGMCVDAETEVLTQRGWLKYNQIQPDEVIMTHEGWKKLEGIYVNPDYDGELVKMSGIDALVTPNHKWRLDTGELKRTDKINAGDKIDVLVEEHNTNFPKIWTDEFWELVGLVVGDGTLPGDSSTKVVFYQNYFVNEAVCDRFEELVEKCGGKWSEGVGASKGNVRYTVSGNLGRQIRQVLDSKKLVHYNMLSLMSVSNLNGFIEGLVASDGTVRESGTKEITTVSESHAEQYAAAIAMAGHRTSISSLPYKNGICYKVRVWNKRAIRRNWDFVTVGKSKHTTTTVWCPSSSAGTFLAKRNGSVYITGNTWVYDKLYLPGKGEEVEKNPNVDVIEVDMAENPHLSEEARERFLSGLSDEERKAREKGEFVSLGGLVYKTFKKETHVIDFQVPPKEWRWYNSIDHGYNNPSAILWHAVSPEGKVITFDIIYKRETTVDMLAQEIKAKNAQYGVQPFITMGDPAMKQRNGVTGTSIIQEYAKHGIFIAEASNDVSSGVDRINQYLAVRENGPMWQITENCAELIAEMRRLRWATYTNRKSMMENNRQEKIHKKDDHACDSARYFFTFMPNLEPLPVGQPEASNFNPLGAQPTVGSEGRFDSNLSNPKSDWDIRVADTAFAGFEYE